MPIRCAPDEQNPTHHIVLNDRKGVTLGLTICDAAGEPKPFRAPDLYTLSPVTTTAFKQTSGNGGYDIFDYPYNPIVQDDTSGGRGNLDFERDSTRFYDSFRATTWRANKAYAGPQEQYATGDHRNVIQSMPGSVDWVKITESNRYLYKRFLATGMTTSKIWLNLRRIGKPGTLTVELWSDTSGALGAKLTSLNVPSTCDTLNEWVNATLEQTITTGVYYWLVVYSHANDTDRKCWKIAVKEEIGTTYRSETFKSLTAAEFDLYFRLTDAENETTCIGFEHMEQQFFMISGTSGAPSLYMMGYRGAADSNTGQLSKLIDATQSWTTDDLVGKVVLIVDGPGKLESQPWRTITANSAGEATVDSPWVIEHTTSTVYVILDDKPRKITGHGLTAPVTDVVVSPTGVVYVCQGDGSSAPVVRRFRAYNDAGTWRDFNDATNCQADEGTLKAVFLVYMPQAQKFVAGNNSDGSGNVSANISTNSSVPAWGTALTWGTAKNVDSKHRRINGMVVHPDPDGNEAVWAFKTDMPYVIPNSSATPYPVGPEEFRAVRSLYNGVRPIRHDVYLYFPLLQGLMKYYGGTYTDMGPNLGEGLPDLRRGAIVSMVSYPGRFFAGVDGGADGYSSVLVRGWHELYRSPKGQRIKHMAFQVIPGSGLDRLWVYQGNDLVWLPFSSDTNELNDSAYLYTSEWSLELSRMHSGMYDIQKMIRLLKVQSDNLEVDKTTNRPICWFELDYKTDDEDEWTTLDDPLTESPTQTVDLAKQYGMAGKRLKFRVRGYTRDANKTGVFQAIIIFSVMRVDVKEFTGLMHILCEDDEPLGLREEETTMGALEKLNQIRDWGDASNDSLLAVRSVSPLLDGKMVYINVGARTQVRFRHESGAAGDAYVVQVSLQDA